MTDEIIAEVERLREAVEDVRFKCEAAAITGAEMEDDSGTFEVALYNILEMARDALAAHPRDTSAVADQKAADVSDNEQCGKDMLLEGVKYQASPDFDPCKPVAYVDESEAFDSLLDALHEKTGIARQKAVEAMDKMLVAKMVEEDLRPSELVKRYRVEIRTEQDGMTVKHTVALQRLEGEDNAR